MPDIALRALLVFGLCLSAFGFGWGKGYQRADASCTQEKQAQAVAVAAADKKVYAEDVKTDQTESRADESYQQAIQTLVVQRNDLAAAIAGLRQRAATVRDRAGAQTCPGVSFAEEVTAATDSLVECAARYSAVAQAHDEMSAQVTGLLEINERNEKLLMAPHE